MADLSLVGLVKTFPAGGPTIGPLNLRIQEGELFTLLGPSGCGKSTTLRMIAGFEEPTAGQVLLGERDLTGMAPNARDFGLVFQNYALFPHLDVFGNVAFGLEMRRLPRDEIGSRVREALWQVGLDQHLHARIDQLSGGQQQRVALARALVIRPRLLLLDEPLSNLDAKLREETRGLLRRIQSDTGVTTIYVTHDQAEAMALSTRLAVMSRGRVEQVGDPRSVHDRPQTRFVASFVGRNNLIEVTAAPSPPSPPATNSLSPPIPSLSFIDVTGRRWDLPVEQVADRVRQELSDGRAQPRGANAKRAILCLRAERFALGSPSDAGAVPATVASVEYQGAVVHLEAESPLGRLAVDLGASAPPRVGEKVGLIPALAEAYVTSAE